MYYYDMNKGGSYFSNGPKFPVSRYRHGCGVYRNKKVIMIGGLNENGGLVGDAYALNVEDLTASSRNTFWYKEANSSASNRDYNFKMIEWNGDLYKVGGESSGIDHSKIYKYSDTLKYFVPIGDLDKARKRVGATLVSINQIATWQC